MKRALYIIAALLLALAVWAGVEVAEWVDVFRRMS